MFLLVSSNPTTKISLTSLVNSIDFPKLFIHNYMIIFQSPNKERRKSLLITWMSLLPNHDLNRGSNTWMFLLPNHDLNPYTNGVVHSVVNNRRRISHVQPLIHWLKSYLTLVSLQHYRSPNVR